MCQGAGCNDPIQIDIPVQTPGQDGQSAFLYVASADTITGTGFSYPADPTQAYRAFLSTTTAIASPVQSNFSGLWFKATGTDGNPGTPGTNGTDGTPAGFEYKFLNYGINTDPGSGYVSTNSANFSLSSIVNISQIELNSVNIQDTLIALNTSASQVKSFVKITNKDDSSKFVVYSVTSATDLGTYFGLNVVYLSSSSVTAFSANDEIIVEFYLTGDKGDKGDAGPSGAFIIGTIGAGTQAYPSSATLGSAYRFTGTGTISDDGAGLLNVRRFYNNDVLYCHTDTNTSDGTKYFIWVGFPRAFRPGAGTDAFCQNVAGSNSATGTNALALGSGSNASGTNAIAGIGATASGDQSLGLGVGVVSSAAQSVAIGAYAEATAASAVALNNAAKAKAITSVAIGANSNIESGATGAFNASWGGDTRSTGRQGMTLGKEGSVEFPGEKVIGHGNFDTGKYNQSSTRLIPQAIQTTNATPTIMTFMPGETSGIVIPQDSAWMISGTIVAARTDTEAVASWVFKGLVKNIAGTAAIVDSILYLDPATGTYLNVSTQFAQDAGMSTAVLGVTVSTTNLVLTVTGIAATNIRWSGTLNVEQVGWF